MEEYTSFNSPFAKPGIKTLASSLVVIGLIIIFGVDSSESLFGVLFAFVITTFGGYYVITRSSIRVRIFDDKVVIDSDIVLLDKVGLGKSHTILYEEIEQIQLRERHPLTERGFRTYPSRFVYDLGGPYIKLVLTGRRDIEFSCKYGIRDEVVQLIIERSGVERSEIEQLD